jgi:hypothetical protein
MFGGFFTPVTEMLQALSSVIIWGLIIFGVVQMLAVITIAVRAYYSLKIIRQLSVLLKEIIREVAELKRTLRDPIDTIHSEVGPYRPRSVSSKRRSLDE